MGRRWNEEDNALLNELWGAQSVEQIARRLRRSEQGVEEQAAKLGYTQSDHQGLYPIRQAAAILGVDPREFSRWKGMGLKLYDGPRRVFGRERRQQMVALDELARFLSRVVEAVDPIGVSRGLAKRHLFDLGCLKTEFRWKQLTCPKSAQHAWGREEVFWAPLYQVRPACPACGHVVSRYATGGYAIEKPPEEPHLNAYELHLVQTVGEYEAMSLQGLKALLGAEYTEATRRVCRRLVRKGVFEHCAGPKKIPRRVYVALVQPGRTPQEQARIHRLGLVAEDGELTPLGRLYQLYLSLPVAKPKRHYRLSPAGRQAISQQSIARTHCAIV